MKNLRSIAVLRALHLGDLLCAVPALRALRMAYPRARITLIGLPWAAEFVERFHGYVDDLMVLPAVPGMPETAAAGNGRSLDDFLDAARQRHFDLAIQLHGNGAVSNDLLSRLGAKRHAGFRAAGSIGSGGPNGSDRARFLVWQDVEHEVLRGLRLLRALGIPAQDAALEFPLTAADDEALRRSCGDPPAPGSYVCIHPGARLPSRRWPPERFAQVADRLAQRGLRVVLTATEAERELAAALEDGMRMPALNLAGKTSLGALGALVAQAALVVCNDTGISHVAAALGVRSVVVCCGSDPLRWAPLDRERHRVLAHPIFCRPCAYRDCPIGHPCALNIDADMVMAQAEELLEAGIEASMEATPAAGRREPAVSGTARRSVTT
ncbi:MAG TPA: glycosyltransferase family 9 protein [Paucimonas sp.]|nr:glycosyltransferase family 9 protein [Paucimonas sp.]